MARVSLCGRRHRMTHVMRFAVSGLQKRADVYEQAVQNCAVSLRYVQFSRTVRTPSADSRSATLSSRSASLSPGFVHAGRHHLRDALLCGFEIRAHGAGRVLRAVTRRHCCRARRPQPAERTRTNTRWRSHEVATSCVRVGTVATVNFDVSCALPSLAVPQYA
jgi:hypothetical protein